MNSCCHFLQAIERAAKISFLNPQLFDRSKFVSTKVIF
jgi:hypothetical protein